MKKMYSKTRKVLAALLLVFIVSVGVAAAQDDPGGGGLGDADGTSVPIDGGLSLLIAAGVGIGAKKVYDQRKKKAGGAGQQ